MSPLSEIILILPRRGAGAETGGLGSVRGTSACALDGGAAAGAGAVAGAKEVGLDRLENGSAN